MARHYFTQRCVRRCMTHLLHPLALLVLNIQPGVGGFRGHCVKKLSHMSCSWTSFFNNAEKFGCVDSKRMGFNYSSGSQILPTSVYWQVGVSQEMQAPKYSSMFRISSLSFCQTWPFEFAWGEKFQSLNHFLNSDFHTTQPAARHLCSQLLISFLVVKLLADCLFSDSKVSLCDGPL